MQCDINLYVYVANVLSSIFRAELFDKMQ